MEFVGKWESVKKEGIETCMNSLGIPKTFIDLSPDLVLQLEISHESDTYTVKEKACITLNQSTFKLGEDFTTTSWLKTPIKGMIQMKDGKMVGKTKEGDVESVSSIQKKGDQLVKTRDIGGSKCTYNKL